MPTVDEEMQERQQYAGLEADAQEQADESLVQEDSPPQDAESDLSSEEDQISQEGTALQTQSEQEKKWNQPPPERWEELRRERDEARRLAQLAIEKFEQPQQAAVPEADPWKGLVDHPDPATAQWYQQQRILFQTEAKRVSEAQLQGVMQTFEAGKRELAALKISQFRKENPDIKPGSQEEALIAERLSQGYDLEDARKLALFDKYESENRAFKAKQGKIPQKRAAAGVERSSGIPQQNGLPRNPGNWRDKAGAVIDKGGSMKDVLKAVF